MLLIAGLLATSSAYTLGFDNDAEKEKLEAEGCEDIVSAKCADEIREWENISGKSFRYLLTSAFVTLVAVMKFEWKSNLDEEE